MVPVVMTGSETGDQAIDVGTDLDATDMIWMLRSPTGVQLPATELQITGISEVTIKLGDFSLAAGTYSLVGV